MPVFGAPVGDNDDVCVFLEHKFEVELLVLRWCEGIPGVLRNAEVGCLMWYVAVKMFEVHVARDLRLLLRRVCACGAGRCNGCC